MTRLEETIQELKAAQAEILDLDRQLNNKKAEYKAKTKAAFGVADGEAINILDVVEMVRKVQAFE